MSAMLASWPTIFWAAVERDHLQEPLTDELKKVLQSHGWVGSGSMSAPRFAELKKELDHFCTDGGPSHGSAVELMGSLQQLAPQADSTERLGWHQQLPSDLQRAGPEIYRNARAEGAVSMRNWICDQVPHDKRDGPQFQSLHSAAGVVDMELAPCRSELEVTQKISASDTCEIHLRALASFVHYRRTKDKEAAQAMLGLRAPGTSTDIAPTWLVSQASAHSKSEFQRYERGRAQARQEGAGRYKGGAKGTPKGKGKGKGKKGKADGGAAGAAGGGAVQN